MYDIVIIGAGVIGAAAARELAKYDLDILFLEKESDVSTGASKANSGIVHGGYVGKAGTLKGELCLPGNRAFAGLEEQLNFGYRKTGGLVIGFDSADREQLDKLYENALAVGQAEDDIEIIGPRKIKEIEPHINEEVEVAFSCHSIGVASPYEMVIALVENAVTNGVDLELEAEVEKIEKRENSFKIWAGEETYQGKYVINAAGVSSEKVAALVGADNFTISPRRGQYILFGKDQAHLVNNVIFQTPTPTTKGVLVTTTYHGNFMIGPNSEEVDQPDDIATTEEQLKQIIKTARRSIPDFDLRRALTTFSGIRASSDRNDFIIEESPVNNFINAAGIDSPGLTASPAIAVRLTEILEELGLELEEKENFQARRPSIIEPKGEDFPGEIDHDDPEKNIICRCETITEAEIKDALTRNIPIETTDAVKRRARAGMGNCQGNFCQSRVKQLIAEVKDMDSEQVEVRDEDKKPERVPINKIRKLDV
ncbi:MAG: NAD(P)/FAD-dependent oxidoreductase [Bacillota bacterium]